jgi:DNA-binding NtrC family response regulator
VRELRNHIERCLILGAIAPAPSGSGPAEAGFAVDATAAYALERERAIAEFERRYLKALLVLHDGKVSRAAAVAGMDRAYFYRILRRHGIEP